tara:strand:- start:6433 stop:6840 length:408 start_codon:yes stop_codon:yes gene_type:complete
MELDKALINLDSIWSREDALKRIQKGESSENIVDDFFKFNGKNIDIVSDYINENNVEVIYQLEELTDCEIKLLKRMRDLKMTNSEQYKNKKLQKNLTKERKLFKIGKFMNKWSNKFVIGALITISLISLTKQAWA